jgi:hypothetical protein
MAVLVAEWVPTPMPKDGLTLRHSYERHFLACAIPELQPFLKKARGLKTDGKKVDLAKAVHEPQEKVLILEAAPDVAMTEAEKLKQPVVLSVPVTTHSEHFTFIAGHEFVVLVQNAFDPKDLHLRQGVDIDRLNEVSEALWKNTKHRLDHHMQQKVTDLKRKSWVLKFVRDNLGRAASAMKIMGYINMKRALANNNKTCVLKNIVNAQTTTPTTRLLP